MKKTATLVYYKQTCTEKLSGKGLEDEVVILKFPSVPMLNKKRWGHGDSNPDQMVSSSKRTKLQQTNGFNHRHRVSAAHRSDIGATYSSQVILCPHCDEFGIFKLRDRTCF